MKDFSLSIIASLVLYFLHHAIHSLTFEFWLKNIKEKKSDELDRIRALKCV